MTSHCPLTWEHKRLWPSRMVYTSIRDGLDIEKHLMAVCPEWHRSSEYIFIFFYWILLYSPSSSSFLLRYCRILGGVISSICGNKRQTVLCCCATLECTALFRIFVATCLDFTSTGTFNVVCRPGIVDESLDGVGLIAPIVVILTTRLSTHQHHPSLAPLSSSNNAILFLLCASIGSPPSWSLMTSETYLLACIFIARP